MFKHSVEELVKKMVIADQTEMVEALLDREYGLFDPDYVNWPEEKRDEYDYEEGIFPEVYSWKLINPEYVDIIRGGNMPHFEFRGQTWLGNTMGADLTHWEYLKGLCEN